MDYCQIELTQGQIARVSPEDFVMLEKYRWHAQWDRAAKTFYAMRNVAVAPKKYHKTLMHREILGFPDGLQVDHKNHDTLDNRRENIRAATTSQNQCNRGPRIDNKSGFKGVSSRKNRWRAAIKVNRKKIGLGSFLTPEDAHLAYSEAALRYHGEFAKSA